MQDDESGVEVTGGETGGDGGTPERHVERGAEAVTDERGDLGG